MTEQQPRIERCNLDGSDRRTIVSNSIMSPVDLAVDEESDSVFWVDAHFQAWPYNHISN